MRSSLFVLLLTALTNNNLAAQRPNAEGAVRIFLDCPTFYCDPDFYRREIAFVDYVRDRQDADVHILIRTQQTGSGGLDFDISFIGLRRLAGIDVNMRHASSQTDTQDEQRRGLARVLKMGLMQYVAGTPAAERIEISYRTDGAQDESRASPEDDPWDFWVFRVRGNGSYNSEESSKRYNVSGSVSANRTTDMWKLESNANGSYSESSFDLSDGSEFVSTSRSWGFRNLLVRSISDHWSLGGRLDATASTFLNQDLSVRVAPGIEYNVFPYSESSSRQFTLLYTIGASHVQYEEETIYGKTDERLFDQSLTGTANFTQPWGSINMALTGTTFLHDLSFNSANLFGGLNVRVVRGLTANLFGSVSRIRDQLHIAAEGASNEEILVRRRQLVTGFRYSLQMGLSYTFGSIFNNVVNPRFDGGGVFFFF